jgi:hypothetical protein
VVNEIWQSGNKSYPSNWIEFQDWFATEDSADARRPEDVTVPL